MSWENKILDEFIFYEPCPHAAFGRLLGALPGIFIPEPDKITPEPDKPDKLPKDPLGEKSSREGVERLRACALICEGWSDDPKDVRRSEEIGLLV